MAIFHLSAKVISRGKGQSAIAAAAYRSGERLRDEQDGTQKYYRARSERIVFTDIMVPKDAPEWALDRGQLWNHAERAEKRKDAQLAREIEVSLPHELTDQQREWLVKDFAREAFVRKGYAVDIAIHAPDETSDQRNHHAHLLVTRRTLGPEGFSATKDWQFDKDQLARWREQWAHLVNRHLERHGHAARIDHRSLKEQGIDPKEREPTVHLGYAASGMAKRGAQSDRMEELRAILARNEIRLDLKELKAELQQLEAAQAEQERKAALKGLAKADRADARKLRDPQSAERGYGDAARAEADALRQVRRDERAAEQQEAWRGRRDAEVSRVPGGAKPARTDGIRVVNGATGVVSGLVDFVAGLLAGATASAAPDRGRGVASDSSEVAARRERLLARLAAQREQVAAAKAMDRMRRDLEAGRALKAEDIANLTHAQKLQIMTKGDDAVRRMVEEDWRRREQERSRDERERDL